jgi:hypothetical protein
VESKGKDRMEEDPLSFNGTNIDGYQVGRTSVVCQAAMSAGLPGPSTDGLEIVDGPGSLVAVHYLGN